MELLSAWAPSQPWFAGDANSEFTNVASYRFDDPEGEVGVETLLVRAGDGPLLQIPLTYRGTPLEDADDWFIGTLEHSVLGTRWVYEGVGDPVYLLTVASAALGDGAQAELMIEIDGVMVRREPTAVVSGTTVSGVATPKLASVGDITVRLDGSVTAVDTGALQVFVARVLGESTLPAAGENDGLLTGTWDGQADPQPLVLVSVGR